MLGQCVIVDWESLGNTADTAVLDLAMLYVDYDVKEASYWNFENLRKKVCYTKFDAVEQLQTLGRVKSQATLDWWKKQSPEAKKVLVPNPEIDVSLLKLSGIMDAYLKNNLVPLDASILARGHFDPAVFDHIFYHLFQKETPYAHYRVHNIRSLLWGMTGVRKSNILLPDEWLPADLTPHSSVDDVVMDALRFKWITDQLS